MSVNNTSHRYTDRSIICSWHNHYNVIHVFVQVIVAESYTLARRIPTPCYLPSLNTFQVSVNHSYDAKKINISGNIVDSTIQTCVEKNELNCLKEGEMHLIVLEMHLIS